MCRPQKDILLKCVGLGVGLPRYHYWTMPTEGNWHNCEKCYKALFHFGQFDDPWG